MHPVRSGVLGSFWVLGGGEMVGKGLSSGVWGVRYVMGRQVIKCGDWGGGCGRDRVCGVQGFRGERRSRG